MKGVGDMPIRIIIMLFTLCSTLLVYSILFAESENYCRDQDSWKEWDELVQKYPNDHEFQALHALRIGLCVKIDKGSITIEQAIDIFENAREAIVEKRKDENRKEMERKKL